MLQGRACDATVQRALRQCDQLPWVHALLSGRELLEYQLSPGVRQALSTPHIPETLSSPVAAPHLHIGDPVCYCFIFDICYHSCPPSNCSIPYHHGLSVQSSVLVACGILTLTQYRPP